MRPVAKAGLGLGYNHCFQRAWYIDLAVSYEFSLYWSQNMLRWLVDTHASEGYDFGTNDIGANPQDLFLQGLVVSLQMNF